MKLILSFLSFCFLLAIIILIGTGYWAHNQYMESGPLEAPKTFNIAPGQGLTTIAYNLSNEGIIANPYVFRAVSQVKYPDQTLKTGLYEFTAHQSMQDVFLQIEDGRVMTQSVTIPEGLTSWQIVNRLNGVLKNPVIDIPPEGSLLPETYQYGFDNKSASVASIIQRMQTDMTQTIDTLWETRADNLPIQTKEEAITLASIVEKETSVPSERKRVAGVFINRLRKNMLLQTDPTVIYALTNGKIEDKGQGPLGRRLLRKDLEFDSPYNTYKYAGLPPGPIANPGRKSIEAVLQPEEHDYIYFVADGTGGHVFAKTLTEHNSNVAKWRRIRNAQ